MDKEKTLTTKQNNGMLDFNELDFNIDLEIEFDTDINTRYIKPFIATENQEHTMYKKAEDLAEQVKLKKGERLYAIVNGSFYFGDFIEALIVKKNIKPESLTISTLSMNQNNVDSLKNLQEAGYIDKLDLIVSDYFYSHERGKDRLIPYIYHTLDVEGFDFQLSVARTHCKIAQFKINNHYIVIHGSANLRSSGNTEQIMIENNKELYDFNNIFFEELIEKGKTIER